LTPETRTRARRRLVPGALIALLLLSGCELRQAMYDQPKYKALEASAAFPDGRSARLPVAGTIAQGQLRLDRHFYEGKGDSGLAATLPMPLTVELLERGHQRFDIYCAPCHDRTGRGNGLIVQRGLKRPPSFHLDRTPGDAPGSGVNLRTAPVGYFYDVMTNGFGAMYSYASRIPPEDRWAIAAYIRTLQFSQQVPYDQLPPEDQRQLQ
jgi:mono/diheme cytochrome c family protein